MITRKFISSSAFAVLSLALIASSPAGAQSKPATSKTVFENGKITVIDSVSKPGEGLPSGVRGGMILYYLSGGTVERTFADGKKETVVRKTGQSLVNSEMRPYSTLNTGSTTVHVIAIRLK
ncbi:MAG TPA: hypothetical protein VFI23_08440 [Rhizomicrobium sp.]|nr:hypothetical protein [Rhizomicrobium sp.]